MKSVKSPEHRITIKVGLIFLVVILFFVGLFTYSSFLRKNIDAQNLELDESYRVLEYSNHLISSIQDAQDALNRYLVSPGRIHRQQYDSILLDISEQIEIIKSSTPKYNQGLLLEDIDSLLNEKHLIVNRLLGLLRSQSPLVELDRRIETIDPVVKDTTVVITNVDTIVVNKQRKDFWSRLSHLVNPKFEPDTTVSITHTEKEARASIIVDTLMYADLKNISEEASKSYQAQIGRIERQVRELVLADQYISLHISKIISEFYNETIQSTRQGTLNSEMLSQKILNFAIVVGALSIVLILIITLLISNDLNNGKNARIALAKEKQLTEDLIDSRHKLLLSVSHDIKTPLSSMMGYMEIWDSEDKNESRKRQLKSARNSGRHILSLLTNLLEFSRLEQKSAVLNISAFNLIELIEDILSMFQPFTEEKKLDLNFNNNLSAPYYIESDYTVIKQILINIISNSVKYTLNGSVNLTVSEIKKNVLQFNIEDTGIGISEEDFSKIFKPFSRVKSSINSEGSGFGLYVTKGLTESLKGNITLDSERGVGTNVEIKLPVKKIENIVATNKDDLQSPQCDTRVYEKVLIFEDDISLGNLIKEFLVQKGYKVKLCNRTKDIKGFLRIISSFDIVFTDMQMFEYTGTEILRDIREIDKDIPVWLMTANDEYSTVKTFNEGFTGLIEKPIHMNKLIQILQGNMLKSSLNNGGNDKVVELNSVTLQSRFPQLSSMFLDDAESIKDLLSEFVANSERDRKLLSEFIKNNQFEKAQRLCHKIHPFYSQLDAEYLATPLRKLDSLKGQDANEYPEWKQDLANTIEKIEEFTQSIKNDFLSS